MIGYKVFPQANIAALFEEAPGGGGILDIDAPRNRPAKFPADWLANIRFHSELDLMEVSHSGSVTINHQAVAPGPIPPGATIAFGWGTAFADHLLLTHNLGYPPFALVAQGTNILWPGMPVQADSVGGGRYASVYCTDTEVRLYEWASTGAATLAAANITYTVLAFKNPPAPSGGRMFGFHPDAAGKVDMSRGKFDSSRRYLQVVPGGSPLGLAMGRTIDLKNGAVRAYRPDGTYFEPVPADLVLALPRPNGFPLVFGGSIGYTGSFPAPASIQVQAP